MSNYHTDTTARLLTNMPFEEYKLLSGLNASLLKRAIPGRDKRNGGTMAHFKAAIDGRLKIDDSDDMRFGRMIHLRLLEPERYKVEAIIAEPCAGVFGSGERKGLRCNAYPRSYSKSADAWFCGKHELEDCVKVVDYVSVEEAADAEAIADSLHNHELMSVFRAPGWTEAVVQWTFGEHVLKSRLDKISVEAGVIIDIKKMGVGCGDRDQCERSITDRCYDVQAAMNVDGARAATGRDYQFVWLFIEDGPPYEITALRADERTLEIGRMEYASALDSIARCRRTGRWPGYLNTAKAIRTVDDLPEGGLTLWARKQWGSITPEQLSGLGHSDGSFG